MKESGFWFVWDDGGEAPRVKHPDAIQAGAEARRLARRHPGRRFILLQSVAAYVVNDIQVIDMAPDEDLPF